MQQHVDCKHAHYRFIVKLQCVCFVSMTTSLCNVLYVIDRKLQLHCVNNCGVVWTDLTQEKISYFAILQKKIQVARS